MTDKTTTRAKTVAAAPQPANAAPHDTFRETITIAEGPNTAGHADQATAAHTPSEET